MQCIKVKNTQWHWFCKSLSYANTLLPIFLNRPLISGTGPQAKMYNMWRLLPDRNNATFSVLQNTSQSPLSSCKLKHRITLKTRETWENDPGTLPSLPKPADKGKLAAGIHSLQTISYRHPTTPPAKFTATQYQDTTCKRVISTPEKLTKSDSSGAWLRSAVILHF